MPQCQGRGDGNLPLAGFGGEQRRVEAQVSKPIFGGDGGRYDTRQKEHGYE